MQRILTLFLTVLVVGSMVASPAMAAPSDDLDFSDDKTPDPYIEWDTVTVATHDAANMSGPTSYYNDNGEPDSLNASLNSSLDEQVGVRYDKIDATAYGVFPRADSQTSPRGVSAVDDAADWTKDVSGSAGTASITDADGSTAGSVPAVQFSTSSQTSGDISTFTYSNFTSLDDAEKRVPLVGMNVDSLESGAEVQVRFEESDGDYVVATASESADATADTTITTGANNGLIWQEKVENMPVQGTGDGQMASVDSITVAIVDANAQVTVFGLDTARKSPVDLGETMEDTDGDGELEETTIQETTSGGVIGLTEMSSLPSMFDSATIYDLEVYGVQHRMSDLTAEEDYSVEFSDAENYAYPRMLEYNARLTPPSAIDLTYSGGELKAHQGLISDRYKTVEMAEGVSDTAFENITSWTAVSDQYTSANTTHTLDKTIQVGQSYAIHAVIVLQNDDESDMKAKSIGAGGGGGFWSGGSAVGSFVNGIIASIAGIAATLGIISRKGS